MSEMEIDARLELTRPRC